MDDTSCSRSTIIRRYTSPMLVPQMNGYDGQVAICNTKVLVVGAGGIGSSAILYLAGAGVGRLDIVDFDNVELCNLHRQIIHDSDSIGCNKAISACNRIHKLNPNVLCQAYQLRITYDNALDIISSYDIVVDATDNFEARYIINEACVELNRVLVSGSSVGMEGQATVFDCTSGPCYRCLYPYPSEAEKSRSCANAGVLGPVPGLVGTLQAIETLKYICNKSMMNSATKSSLNCLIGRQAYYDATTSEFYNFQLLSKNTNCLTCSSIARNIPYTERIIKLKEMLSPSVSQSCRVLTVSTPMTSSPSILLDPRFSIALSHYVAEVLSKGVKHVIIDVRSSRQYSMITLAHSQIYSSNLQGDISNKSMENIPSPIDIHSHPITDDPEICVMVNIPFGELSSAISDISSSAVSRFKGLVEMYPTRPIYVLCRRGMDSQRAVLLFQRVLHQWANATARHDEMSGNSDNTSVLLNEDSGCAIDPVQHRSSVNLSSDFYTTKIHQIYNLEGGLKSWGAEIDSDFPSY